MNNPKQRMEVFKNLAEYSEEMFSNNLKSNKAITNFKLNSDSKATLSSKISWNTIDLKKFYNQLQRSNPLYGDLASNINEILKKLYYMSYLIKLINFILKHLKMKSLKKVLKKLRMKFLTIENYIKSSNIMFQKMDHMLKICQLMI